MSYYQRYLTLANKQRPQVLWIFAFSVALAGLSWLLIDLVSQPALQPTQQPSLARTGVLQGPVVAAMASPVFVYSQGWQISESGADPAEPTDPWQMPAGTLRFTYTGAELALRLAPGDYWSYLYLTVDGQPANLLPQLGGNLNSRGQASGYRTLYAPENQSATGPTPQWVRVHRADDATQPHTVYLELWRGWGQMPLRGVAVDGLSPAPWPRWPGVALLLLAGWSFLVAGQTVVLPSFLGQGVGTIGKLLRPLLMPAIGVQVAPLLTIVGLLLVWLGVLWTQWLVTGAALLLIGWCGLQRPALWLAVLLLGLPFYYHYPLPILPTRALSVIDVGILGGWAVLTGHWLLLRLTAGGMAAPGTQTQHHQAVYWQPVTLILVAISGWALLSAVEAAHSALALREWRTVFLTGTLFALLLGGVLRLSAQAPADQWLLVGAWLTGATLVALVGLWQYISNDSLISAEGVQRVRAFYGSPNNLALYLERALAPLVAGALFAERPPWRWLAGGAALLLGVTLFLTFSKGALLLGLPALLGVLWIGGLQVLRQRGQSRRLLWALAGIGGLALLALLPFLGAERFQRLLDFQSGTGFVRLQLWRSAWQMALDHPFFGVGPDNFLYAYRTLYLLPAAWQEPNLNHPHNWPLDWWTRLGLPGLLLALLWFTITLRGHWRHLCANHQPVLSLGLLAAGVAALAHGLIDASYALPDLMIVWVLLSYLPFANND